MKLMPELESLMCIYPKKCLCALLYAAYASSNFKFRTIAKNAGTFGRDLGAKFSINDPKIRNHQNMLAEEWSRNCHF